VSDESLSMEDLPPISVLLVDDDESVAAGLAAFLGHSGFEVTSASRGGQVLGMLAASRPAVVVLDLSLPDVEGFVVAEVIRKAWPTIPIIFMTGHQKNHPGLQAVSGWDSTAVILKPFMLADLIDLIHLLAS